MAIEPQHNKICPICRKAIHEDDIILRGPIKEYQGFVNTHIACQPK